MKKQVFPLALVITIFLVTLIVVINQYQNRIYVNNEYGFSIKLSQNDFSIICNEYSNCTEIAFADKKVRQEYPEWDGTIFTLFIYRKDDTLGSPFNSLDGPQYIGENDRYYFGVRMTTDRRCPDSLEAHYTDLWNFAREYVLESFSALN